VSQHLQKPFELDRGVRPSQEQSTGTAYMRESEARRLRHAVPPPDGAGRITVEGCTASAAQTTLPLFVGTTEIGPGKPDIPVGRATLLRTVTASFFTTSAAPTDPWTLSILVRRDGESHTITVATASILTSIP
jgi:hypothetical protein